MDDTVCTWTGLDMHWKLRNKMLGTLCDVYIYVHTYRGVCIYSTHLYIVVHVFIIYLHMYVYIYIGTQLWDMCRCVYIYIYIHTSTAIYIHMYKYLNIYIYISIFILHIYRYVANLWHGKLCSFIISYIILHYACYVIRHGTMKYYIIM